MDWNNPPVDYIAWRRFVYQLALALRDYPNVLSYEIYNEQNARLWWDGSIAQYKATLRHAALAIRMADPDAQVLLGGFVLPDVDWLRAITEDGYARYYDIAPFHTYPETWTTADVVVENYLDERYREFVRQNQTAGDGEPIWINEMGFAVVPGRSERDQANWWARAVSTFLADPAVEHIGVYEIKDLPLGKETIGDEKNHFLGITRIDRTKKLAFHTVALLKNLLGQTAIAPADTNAMVTLIAGAHGDLHHHLFKRADGKQVLFIYDKAADLEVRVRLRQPGKVALRYELDGTATIHRSFDGTTLENIRLSAGDVTIFRIDPLRRGQHRSSVDQISSSRDLRGILDNPRAMN